MRKTRSLVPRHLSFFFFAQNSVLMAVVDVGQQSRHAGRILMCGTRQSCISALWCSFVHVFHCGKGKGIHPPVQRAVKFVFRSTGVLMAARKNQPPVPRHLLPSKQCPGTTRLLHGRAWLVPGQRGGGRAGWLSRALEGNPWRKEDPPQHPPRPQRTEQGERAHNPSTMHQPHGEQRPLDALCGLKQSPKGLGDDHV